METIILVAAFLAFIAWRERQHALELRAVVSRRSGGIAPSPVASSRRRKKGAVRVISPEDDKAFNEKKERQEAEVED